MTDLNVLMAERAAAKKPEVGATVTGIEPRRAGQPILEETSPLKTYPSDANLGQMMMDRAGQKPAEPIPSYGEIAVRNLQVAVPVGGTIGAGIGALTGGPAGAGVGALAGMTFEALSALGEAGVEKLLLEQGWDPMDAQIAAAGFGLTAGGAVSKIGRAATDVVGRAGRQLAQAGELGDMGAEGAEVVADMAVRGHRMQKASTDKAYELWRTDLDPEANLSARRIVDHFDDLDPTGEFLKGGGKFDAIEQLRKLPSDEAVSAERLNEVRSSLSEEASVAFQAGQKKQGRRILQAIDKIDELELEMAVKFGDEDSLLRLHRARKQRQILGEIEHGQFGRDKEVYAKLIDPKTSADDAQVAVTRILTNPRSMEALRQLRTAADAAGGPAEVKRLDRALRRSSMQYLFGRNTGATGEGAANSAGAVVNKLEKNKTFYNEILGPKGYEYLHKNLATIVSATKGADPFAPTVHLAGPSTSTRALLTMIAGGGAGGSAIAAGGGGMGPVGMAALGVGGGGAMIHFVAAKFGPKAARNLALIAMYDARVHAQLMRKAGNKEGFARVGDLMAGMVRRGLVSHEIYEGDE